MKTIDGLPKSALLDTTFLVDLANPTSPHRPNAQDYALKLLAGGTAFYLSALVMAEFAVKGDVDSVVATFKPTIITFSPADALIYAELVKLHPGIFSFKIPDKERVVIDVMLMAQAKARSIESVISTDSALCTIYTKGTSVRGIDIKTSFNEFIASGTPLFGDRGLN